DREVYLSLWIVLFSFLGLYYLGKIKFKGDSDIKYLSFSRLVLSVFTFTFVVYMIPGMFGAPLKAISGYIPPMTTLDFDFHKIVRDEINLAYSSEFQKESLPEKQRKYSDFLEMPHGLKGYFDYKEGMNMAKKLKKPVFIDFTGHGCVNCRKMEASVWSDPRVLERLNNDYVLIALYIDDKTKLPEKEWVTSSYDGKVKKTLGRKNSDFQISEFGVNAQPYYVLLDNEGNKLVKPKAYDLNIDNFVEFLDNGLRSFENRENINNKRP
ncbi:MAG: thioredoxin family protein, partial [Prolixibacteraceae bacterium]|nr:thioredoxin family protein [Prolixibacteraceae bacterium]